jgi:hypothetical protein
MGFSAPTGTHPQPRRQGHEAEAAGVIGWPERPAGHTTAARRGRTDLFFPSEEGKENAYDVARSLWAGPVVEPCRDARAHEAHGMWDGASSSERRSTCRFAG